MLPLTQKLACPPERRPDGVARGTFNPNTTLSAGLLDNVTWVICKEMLIRNMITFAIGGLWSHYCTLVKYRMSMKLSKCVSLMILLHRILVKHQRSHVICHYNVIMGEEVSIYEVDDHTYIWCQRNHIPIFSVIWCSTDHTLVITHIAHPILSMIALHPILVWYLKIRPCSLASWTSYSHLQAAG